MFRAYLAYRSGGRDDSRDHSDHRRRAGRGLSREILVIAGVIILGTIMTVLNRTF